MVVPSLNVGVHKIHRDFNTCKSLNLIFCFVFSIISAPEKLFCFLVARPDYPVLFLGSSDDLATRAMLPCLVLLVYLSLVTAVEMVYSVWTKIPDNTAVLTGVAAGQFKSNSDLGSFLHRVGKDVSSSTCHSLGAKGHTWYWTAKLKEDDVKALKTQRIVCSSLTEND